MQFRNILEELEATKFRKKIEREIESYFEDKGFSIIEPKMFQDYDSFIKTNITQDTSKTVKVLGGDSKIYILRPDITTNILSQIFSKWEGEPPLKVYYNSKVYKTQTGGEILANYQMGVESLGEDILKADKEILEMASSLMSDLGQAYIIELGSSKYLDGFFSEIDLDMTDEIEIKGYIRKKNRDSLNKKLKALGIEDSILSKVLDMQGNMNSVIAMAKSYRMNEEMKIAIRFLEQLNEYFTFKDVIKTIKLDLSMIADLDYYDGIIFRAYCQGVSNRIISGGRYDKSTKNMGLKVPAIGFMIDMDLVTSIRNKGEK